VGQRAGLGTVVVVFGAVFGAVVGVVGAVDGAAAGPRTGKDSTWPKVLLA